TLLVTRPSSISGDVAGGRDEIGVRVPAHTVTRELCRVCGRLLTATSANLSGAPPSNDPDEIERALGDRVDLLLDAGKTPGGAPSTCVGAGGGEGRFVRRGATGWDDVKACRQRVWAGGRGRRWGGSSPAGCAGPPPNDRSKSWRALPKRRAPKWCSVSFRS